MTNHPTGEQSKSLNFQIADISLAEAGRHQISLAENEMPGLMALRKEYEGIRPLAGARVTVSLSITIQTAVFVETLVILGARVRLASCNIFSSQDEAAAALVVGSGTESSPAGIEVFGWKGESTEDYWDLANASLDWSSHNNGLPLGPTSIVDDGGDLIYLLHQGVEFEKTGELAQEESWDNHEFAIVRRLLEVSRSTNQTRFTDVATYLVGASEETTTGIQRVLQLQRDQKLLFPVVNVNDAVTKSKFDNKYGIRHSLVDGLNRATDVLIGGKVAFVAGYGDVGKGCAEALRGQGARVIVSEIDPICALQAAMDGFQVARLESVIEQIDFFVTTTGNRDIFRPEHFSRMKNLAILANVGHFDNEIDMVGLAAIPGITATEIKPLVHEWHLPSGRSLIVLSEGRVMNLGNATGHPSFIMSASFSNQVLAQIEIATNGINLDKSVHLISKKNDEKVARLHLPALGVELTELSASQARYIGVPIQGPFKTEHYRY
jgi:adenosylhomocysteinase